MCVSPIAAAGSPAGSLAGFGGRNSASASTGDATSAALEEAAGINGAKEAAAPLASQAESPSPAFAAPNPRLLTPKQLMKQVNIWQPEMSTVLS